MIREKAVAAGVWTVLLAVLLAVLLVPAVGQTDDGLSAPGADEPAPSAEVDAPAVSPDDATPRTHAAGETAPSTPDPADPSSTSDDADDAVPDDAPRGDAEAPANDGEVSSDGESPGEGAASGSLPDDVGGVDETLVAQFENALGDTANALGPTFRDTPWWGWGALFVGILAGLVVGKTLQFALNGLGSRLESRRKHYRATVARNAGGPLNLVFITAGLLAGLTFIAIDAAMSDLAARILALLLLIALGWFLYNLVDLIEIPLRRITRRTRNKLDDQMVGVIRKSLRILLVVMFTLVIAQNVFELNITGWLAGLGIAGLAVSLAAQDSIKNLFGSITVMFDRPFALGDRVRFEGFDGPVERIGFRSTRIRTLEGHLVTVPNMKWIDQTVENVGARPHIRRDMEVTITYDTPPDKIEEAVSLLKDILNAPDVADVFDMEAFPPQVAFNELNADSLNIKAIYWYTVAPDVRDYWTYLQHAQLVNLRLFRAFAEAGIDFAFPTQTIHLANDDKRQLAVRVLEANNDAAGPTA